MSPDLYSAFDQLWSTAMGMAGFAIASAALVLFALAMLAAVIDRSKSRRSDEKIKPRRGAMR